MFVLRQINKDGLQTNLSLGEEYSITHKERSPDSFQFQVDELKDFPQKDQCYAVISFNNGSEWWPLYQNFQYYIMTGGGKTFDNVTFR